MKNIEKAFAFLFCLTVFAGCAASDAPAQTSIETTSEAVAVTEEITAEAITFKMPELMGMNSSEAKNVIGELGLKFSENEESSLEFPDDTVIYQSPEAGAELESIDEISITINVLPTVIVPELTGFSASEAVRQLEAMGIEAITEPDKLSDASEYEVESQSIAAGEEIKAGSQIALTLKELITDELPDVTEITAFNIYTPEVFAGVPDICDIDSILASRRDDMCKYASPCCTGEVFDEETDELVKQYADSVEYAEEYFGFSFDKSSPVFSYVKDDFDLDGKDEYYLCMLEYLNILYDVSFSSYDSAALISVYYINDNGNASFAFGKVLKRVLAESSYEPFSLPEEEMLFTVNCGYEYYNQPQIIDYGGSKHLFWDQNQYYPNDYGAELFWTDRHIRIEYSEPSERLRGFYDCQCLELNVTPDQEADLYNGIIYDELGPSAYYLKTNHFLIWNGSEYVHTCIEYDPETHSISYTAKDEPVLWELHQ